MSARQSSAVDRALKLIRNGMSAYAAAQKCKLAMTTVYRAIKRHPEMGLYLRPKRKKAG